ncbi:type II toxin-antitoxin system MqsR family toxin [Levilactobacillus tujiorum]|uniref:Type II toxin-antitoxin system MqsR family toxin n=1 Tax=Levilactobacillus tujiorum TaxID=2912243 RepID=A0ABX1L6R3_9LACO|nr:type II toxin-antitoxin system MqsR family toxin [Levilactobacillus tujiorum]MCH5465054.1 type II toxin-antitoxin system MqsR family toxin [Levilactobacillus tujiorum]NLR12088.1 type II toxin-antitoxin system MqsR family toxin [Lactobacillus sp. HBUAS51387]NLR30044.1 type II toxin-antitoxin system MqsR family toxin [Levilactobacillus tujiorum]
MASASKTTIRRFLQDFKKALSHGDWEIVQRRVEYAQATEMTPESIKIILMKLTPDDYVKGPELDRDRPGEYLWVFYKNDETEKRLYIKLKLMDGHAKVISFHETIYD